MRNVSRASGIPGESEIRLRQVAEHAGMIAPRARGALEVVHGGRGIAELQQRRSEQVQRVRMIRRDGERLLVRMPRGVEVPPGMLAQSGFDLSLHEVFAGLHSRIMTGRLLVPLRALPRNFHEKLFILNALLPGQRLAEAPWAACRLPWPNQHMPSLGRRLITILVKSIYLP